MDEEIKLKVRSEDSHDDSKISWLIEEPRLAPKTAEWYWALGILAAAIVIFSILLKNYLLIIIVGLAAFIFYTSKNNKPSVLHFHLNNEGLHIGTKFYPYDNFESFWIFPARADIESGTTTLNEREFALRNKRHVVPLLIIPFRNNDEVKIRKILLNHLPENEEKESFIDMLEKRFF